MNRRDLLLSGAALAAGSVLTPETTFAEDRKTPAKKAAPKGPRLVVRRSGDRGVGRHGGWLYARYTFSFSRYYDAEHRGFRALRVMNEDVIQETKGFPMHPHRDMEILTYVMGGALRHKDSLGNGGVIVPGMVQRMSAGRGIRHSEFNPSKAEDAHLYQIWMLPSRNGTRPSYAEKKFAWQDHKGVLRLVASPSGAQDSITIGSDVNLYSALLAPKQKIAYPNRRGRHVWIQIARGSVKVNHETLAEGDGVRTSDVGKLVIEGVQDSELLLFDLA